MRAGFVVVADVFREQPFQMAFIDRNSVVQQASSAAFDPTLRNSILPRTPQRSANTVDLHRSDRGGDLRPILGITIEDDKPRRRPKWKRFSQLLDDPQAARMPGDVGVQDPPPIMADDEKAIEQTKGDRWDCEEVHRGDGLPMVSKEGEPTFGWLGIPRSSFHPTGDGSLGGIKTEHEEFPVYPRRSPGRILNNHPEDHISHLLRNSSAPCWFSDPGDQAPIETEAWPMPPSRCLGRDDDQPFFPSGPKLMGTDPEKFVEQLESWPRMPTFQNGELLPKRKILQHKLPTATKNANEYTKPEQEEVVHEPRL
jgi:hypothetical protein